jgi:long-chain acyl-CoA synthetase
MFKLKDYTLGSVLESSADRFPDKPGLSRVNGRPWSYAEIRERVAVVSDNLRLAGVAKGDRVAILCENRPEWVIAYLGVTTMGAIIVPILVDFTPAQILAILDHSGAKAVFVSNKYLKKFDDLKNRLGIVNIDEEFETMVPHPEAGLRETVLPDDVAAIIYTSGTTGASKGVELTHRNMISDAVATKSIIRMSPRDCLVSILPLAHTYECTIGFLVPFAQGACIYYLDKPPTAQALLPALATIRPTAMLSVPLIIEKIVRAKVIPELEKHPAYRNPLLRPFLERVAGMKLRRTFGNRIRFFGIGGAGVAPDVEAFLYRARFPYALGYGLTETAPLIAACNSRHLVLRSTGTALRGVELRIADPNPETGEGEIQARGDVVMKGYYRDEARTREAFTKDGWFRTGDLGVIDRRGRLFIRGRLKTMILGPSGENIYPEEIEAVLNAVEGIQDSLVYEEETGGLVALVYFDPAFRERLLAEMQDRIELVENTASEALDRIRKEVNASLTAFSRLGRVVEQPIPFEKTPTQKIKRFLYPKAGAKKPSHGRS